MVEHSAGMDALAAVIAGRSDDPFAVLGPHDGVVTALVPGASAVQAIARDGGAVLSDFELLDEVGLFAGPVPVGTPYLLRIDWHGTLQETEDSYEFGPLLGPLDIYLIAEGRHRELASCLGAHAMRVGDTEGVRFAVWAPNAKRVSVVGDFNGWDGRRHAMRRRHDAGVWEIFVPRLRPGVAYKYEILGPDWQVLPLKADPVAACAESPPATASVVADPTPPRWTDAAWLASRGDRQRREAPMSICCR
jgi:1,4-alpha-glucan branching enzyme